MMDQAKSEYAESPLEIFKSYIVHRGLNSIKGILRCFKIMDDDRSKSLSLEEFSKGLQDFGVPLSEEQMHDLFRQLDKDGQGTIQVDQFLKIFEPKLSDRHRKLVEAAFRKMDKTGDGVVTVKDIKMTYKPKKHPKYVNGEWTEAQVCEDFLHTFEMKRYEDGKVTFEEFILYYASVSSTINDAVFERMITEIYEI